MGGVPPPSIPTNEDSTTTESPSPADLSFPGGPGGPPGVEADGVGGYAGHHPVTDGQSALPPQHQHSGHFGGWRHAPSSPHDMAQQLLMGRGNGLYHTGAMMNALPQQQTGYRPGPGHGLHYNAGQAMAAGPQLVHPAAAAYVGAGSMTTMQDQQAYYMSQHGHVPQFYGGAMPVPQQPNHDPASSGRPNVAYYPQNPAPPQYWYAPVGPYPNQGGAVLHSPVLAGRQFVQQHQQHQHQQQQHQQQHQPAHAADHGHVNQHHRQQLNLPQPQKHGQYQQQQPQQQQQQQQSQHPQHHGLGGGNTNPPQQQGQPDGAKVESRSSVVRGPPRKPRQSGHAVWIGNLPPQTDLMNLVYHVCKEAPGLESLFLISKSNCAFANFKDEQTCVAAQQKLHDSKFESVRLVSRLRKSTVEGASGIAAPTGPAAASPNPPLPSGASREGAAEDASSDGVEASTGALSPQQKQQQRQLEPTSSQPAVVQKRDKYFILKSLTTEDLELSVQTGIWATQAHNEKSLNAAFHSAENVYLIFSANKSGEYFGYARMTSPINEDPAAAIEFAPKAQSASDVGLPKAIPTAATEFAPRGSIMDDSERGTIFWEADLPPEEPQEDGEGEAAADDAVSTKSGGGGVAGPESKAWGKPFKLEWICTTRLAFYKARGLRNPWNSNREVKVARDGTELEPTVGRKLTSLLSSAALGSQIQQQQQQQQQQQPPQQAMPAMPAGSAIVSGGVGYAPMRPPFQKP